MVQILHFQKTIGKSLERPRPRGQKIILFFALLLSFGGAKAQMTQEILNGEYREIILKQLQKNVEKREATMRDKAERYLLSLPNDRKLYDETKLNIKADLVSGITKDGMAELNYRITIDYTCHHFESLTDNYPTGQYLCSQSNASMALCELTRMMVDEVSSSSFKEGKKAEIKLKATTDITEVTHLDYGGEYGDFRYEAARYNGESVRISVSTESGISSNAQLAFLRAQGLKDNISKNVEGLKKTENSYSYDTRSYNETGSQYRDVSIEILVHSAFDEEIVQMNEKLINDEYVDYNIPKVDENSNAKTFVLIIANERYTRPLPDVPYAYNDGEVLQQYCIRTLGIPQRQVKIIEDATMQDIKKEGVTWLKNIASSQKGDCQFIIYYAGHGLTDYERNPYLVPSGISYKGIKALKGKEIDVDTRMSGSDTKKLLKQCLRIDTLCAWFNRVPVRSITMIVDATFDGNQRDGEPLVNMKLTDKKVKGLRIRNDIVLIGAAAYDKTAYAFDEQRHGFLTYYILKELKSRKGDVDLYDLFNSVDLEVQRESSLQGHLQEPTVTVGGKLKDTWGKLRLKP
ncbi:MAG: caspase family protein [Bacteroidales bacterium]|nr:caspase family protein [Bacteroidales bacterium]